MYNNFPVENRILKLGFGKRDSVKQVYLLWRDFGQTGFWQLGFWPIAIRDIDFKEILNKIFFISHILQTAQVQLF